MPMEPPIRCTCGNNVGPLYPAYVVGCAQAKKEYYEKNKLDPNYPSERTEFTVGHILDKLGLTRDCCRTVIFTYTDLMDYM